MPACYTHHVFTKDVYKVIDDKIKEKMVNAQDLFNLFGKSFDVLFFSRAKLGHFAHNNNVNLYFQNIIKYIRDNNLQDNGDVLAYLYGSICHYVLDSTCHPYIYYKTGKYNKKDKKTWKYKGLHNYYEYMIDAIIYQDRNLKNIKKAKLSKECFPSVTFSLELKSAIEYAYANTFCAIKASSAVYTGYYNYRFIMKHGFESHFGIKRGLYKIIDKTNLVKALNFSPLCYNKKELDKSVLNLEHNKWYYPVDRKINYHYSFYDLYDLSIEKARKLINMIDEALDKDDTSINKVLKEIGDNSYCTGKKAGKKYKNQIYEF